MSLRVLSPGLLTSVQAMGRSGHRHLGVANAGALDEYSLQIGNLLVGNAMAAAALEITYQGPRLLFEAAARIAITGADIDARIADTVIPGWRPVVVPAGAELSLSNCRRGARAYLCIASGIKVPEQLGSTSTDLRAGFGGFAGRSLIAGDRLEVAMRTKSVASVPDIAAWWIDPAPDLDFSSPTLVRVLTGSDALAVPKALFDDDYRISPVSNRQGLRMKGNPLIVADARERISEPVAPGTVQLPPDGQPIVLLADAQTVGGYPRIGHVISADWPRLAQLRPGDLLRFQAIDASTARELACRQRHRLARIALAIRQRLR